MKRLRFLHIPKTAGRTLEEILRRQYFGRKNFALAILRSQYFGKKIFGFTGDLALDLKQFEALSEYDRENLVLFYGHAPIVTGLKEADNVTTITLLRDPINRVKAYCQHIREGKSPYLINDFPPDSFNLDSFLESGTEELSNLQTKMLINNVNCASPLLINKMSTSEVIDTALDNLYNKISYFGLTEYFDESLIVFSSALNWGMPFYTPINLENTTKLIKFEERHIERIAELNAIDMDVYRLAKEHFIGILNSSAFDEAKLKRFQFINNTLYSPVIHIKDRIIGPKSATPKKHFAPIYNHK